MVNPLVIIKKMFIKKIQKTILVNNVLILCGLLLGCWPSYIPRNIEKSIIYYYDSIPTGLDTIIPINGYYELVSRMELRNVPDSVQRCLIFYPDGLFFTNGSYHNQNYIIENDTVNGIYDRLAGWGNYVVVKDTIKTFHFDGPNRSTWIAYEDYYLINKDKTLKWFYSSELTTRTYDKEYVEKVREKLIKNTSVGRFYKLDSLPNPKNSWIMKAKWFRSRIM